MFHVSVIGYLMKSCETDAHTVVYVRLACTRLRKAKVFGTWHDSITVSGAALTSVCEPVDKKGLLEMLMR